ncbi:hypothetical protein SAMN05421835_13223 [Amycolatopsis sacchari]|uniref:TRAP transporter solute receptor, TAXI family n=1 Tax=Amycolatopsis sacchari TaxID=115433 RepID=A0A1I4C5E6_9PSEU|nr:hypothetical protein [Amycolatopsis sacchari]SFK75607.1 hypothetical protein SAMN05421835_13223 [Amycolatopsis sacchari]
MTTNQDAPVIDREISLIFQGDWGQANLHRICGWLAQELGDRCAPGSRFGIWSGRGGADAVHAVLAHDVDAALLTPVAAAAGLPAGTGPLAVAGAGRLRALGTLPQRDRLVTCVDAALGVSRMSELAELLPALRIATSPDDGVNLIGAAAHRQLEAIGVSAARLDEAGGGFVYSERPFPAIAAFRDGTANVLIHEAIMTPAWQRVTERKEVTYLDVDPAVTEAFARWHWPTATVPAGYLPGLAHDLTALEFSDFLLVCREDLPDDIAALIAWCLVCTRQALEVQYRHLPADRSPVTYPLDPRAIATAPIPLHPAAEETYSALGDGADASGALMWA